MRIYGRDLAGPGFRPDLAGHTHGRKNELVESEGALRRSGPGQPHGLAVAEDRRAEIADPGLPGHRVGQFHMQSGGGRLLGLNVH